MAEVKQKEQDVEHKEVPGDPKLAEELRVNSQLVAQHGQVIAPIIPRTLKDAAAIGETLARAGVLPKGYRDGKQATVAILKGLEIGLPPMTAVQYIYVVNGVPTVFGDAAVALARASGKVEYLKEWYDLDDNGLATCGYCELRRADTHEVFHREFTREQAIRAGLWERNDVWRKYPERMLQMRARRLALSDGLSDVLLGLRLFEEVADERGLQYRQLPDGSFDIAEPVHVTDPLGDDDDEATPEDDGQE